MFKHQIRGPVSPSDFQWEFDAGCWYLYYRQPISPWRQRLFGAAWTRIERVMVSSEMITPELRMQTELRTLINVVNANIRRTIPGTI